jgi:hypothetical protein
MVGLTQCQRTLGISRMRAIAILTLLISLISLVSVAADQAPKRPRDRYQKPVSVDAATTKNIIGSILRYKEVLQTGDYGRFYRECFHSVSKERETEASFSKSVAPVAPKLIRFFSDILSAYENGLHKGDDFQIGRMPDSVVKDSFVIQFADRIDDTTAKRWPHGAPLRIQIAPDGDTLNVYDID